MDAAKSLSEDRYVSFCNIDCDGMALRMLPLARKALDSKGYMENPFWQRFCEKAIAIEEGKDIGVDALYLVCSHIMYLAEVFDDETGSEGQELLESIEMQCA